MITDDGRLTIRDYFAAAAMQGMLSANPRRPFGMDGDNVDQIIAKEAYKSADAMMAERNKEDAE